MQDKNPQRLILHVSDFHLTENEEELKFAKTALDAIIKVIKKQQIRIDYLFHTGDIIDSSDLFQTTAQLLAVDEKYYSDGAFCEKLFRENADAKEKEDFDSKMIELMTKRFNCAKALFNEFVSNLNIPFGNVVICSGNHDVPRLFSGETETVSCEQNADGGWCYKKRSIIFEPFEPFETFLKEINAANSIDRCGYDSSICLLTLDSLKILVLNTNWENPVDQKAGYYCVRCDLLKKLHSSFFDGDKESPPNIILAHKPIYEICEKARLPFQRYIKTDFMSIIQRIVGNSGIYFCGDKHTRSIVGSFIHDIPHYIGGEPLHKKGDSFEVEYNLVAIQGNHVGIGRKVHLLNNKESKWTCDIRPQDNVVSELYDLCKSYIFENTYDFLLDGNIFRSWDNLCQEIYNWKSSILHEYYFTLNRMFRSICKYRENGVYDIKLDKENIFKYVSNKVEAFQKESTNILNIRGEHGSGKSIFLEVLYFTLLYDFSIGKTDIIPAYFNLDSEIVKKELYMDMEESYNKAVAKAFKKFAKEIQRIATKENFNICFIIDGLDEQDCWSFRTEDSVGRGILDVLSEYPKAKYIMSFSQQKLPRLKNTMPSRTYNDDSDILYFNPIDIQAKESSDIRFRQFVKCFIKIKNLYLDSPRGKYANEKKVDVSGDSENIEKICDVIRGFRRLTINPSFVNDNYSFITTIDPHEKALKYRGSDVESLFQYYIDQQYDQCMKELGYGFITYAPAMAYLFAYKGFTYERFKRLDSESNVGKHILDDIRKNREKVYNTFIFIKKNKDVRTYLIAIHYNRELRFYTENPDVDIQGFSILNEYLDRDVSVMIRKLWTDANKFVIATEQLLKRENLPACLLSVLLYCLAHIDLYSPIKEELCDRLKEYCDHKMKLDWEVLEQWSFDDCNSILDKINRFFVLGLKHTLAIYQNVDKANLINLEISYYNNEAFKAFNRQFQMLYYGDITLRGEDKKRSLCPGEDKVYKGFDFHNTFNYLFEKLNSDLTYPLAEFDLFTIVDLVESRIQNEFISETAHPTNDDRSFFHHDKYKDRAKKVLTITNDIIERYLKYEPRDQQIKDYFNKQKNKIQAFIEKS